MKYIELNNGVLMPQLGIGTFLVESGDIAYNTVKKALEIGYRHIDTAQMYKNEASIGQAIKDSNIKREEIFITTKQMRTGDLDYMKNQFESSLKALQTDYVDLYLIHWPNPDKLVNQETWKFFEKLYHEKKVRAIGISNFQKHMVEDILDIATIKPAVNQVECHPGLSQEPLKKYLDSIDIELESYGPLMKGGVFGSNYAEVLGKIAQNHQKSIAQIVVAWGLQRGIIMIPKSTHEIRIKENFEAQFITLSDDEMDEINRLNRGNRVYTDPDNSPWGYYVK